jgi:hypothetical protein
MTVPLKYASRSNAPIRLWAALASDCNTINSAGLSRVDIQWVRLTIAAPLQARRNLARTK